MDKKSNGQYDNILDEVECSGKEPSLWHCRAKRRRQNSSISYAQRVGVSCAGTVVMVHQVMTQL